MGGHLPRTSGVLDLAVAIDVDNYGNVYVTGYNNAYVTIKYSQCYLPGDCDSDFDVDMDDLGLFSKQWLLEELSADVAPDGGDGIVNFVDWAVIADGWQETTDMNDVNDFVEQWLQLGSWCADVAPPGGDGIVNFLDFAAVANYWMEEIDELFR